jgi:hypothetical protein
MTTKLGIAPGKKGVEIHLKKDKKGNYPLPVERMQVESGNLSPAGTTQAVYFPASLPAYNPAKPMAYAQHYLHYLLSGGHKAKLAQGDPIRLEGMIIGAQGEPHYLTLYQVLHGGDDTLDYLVAVLHDPVANGNGAGVGHPR